MSNICKVDCLSSNACSNLHFHCFEVGTCFVDCDESNGIDCPSYGVYSLWTTQEPTNNPTNNPSITPSNIPSHNPSNASINYNYPTELPSQLYMPTSNLIATFDPSNSPSLIPSNAAPVYTTFASTVSDFQLFNVSQVLDLVFNSTLKRYNASNLLVNSMLQNDMVSLLEQVSESKISNTIDNVIAIKINAIWVYNGSVENDCELEENINDDRYYLSWIRFYIKFINLEKQEQWDSELEEIIDVFGNELSKLEYFINDTISISYCTSSGSQSVNNFEYSSTVGTVCIMSFFLVIGLCACVDARIVRRNESFSIIAILSAAAYTVDIVSGV